MATRCPVCSGRVLKTAEGTRCMNTACAGAAETTQEGIPCQKCGEAMNYTGLDLYGQPTYSCQSCGNRTRLSE